MENLSLTCPIYMLAPSAYNCCLEYFNPRTHEGCDKPSRGRILRAALFQSTHPWRVRHLPMDRYKDTSRFQSTHPWRVRRTDADNQVFGYQISIHAPMKGATNHVPLFRSDVPHFNPRTHEGCDAAVQIHQIRQTRISIHAPMKGATRYS